MEKEIIALIADVLEVPIEEVSMDTCIGDIPTWDSMGHLAILQAIQEKYDVVFAPRERLMAESVEDIINTVKNKLK